jgi:secreted PhoX family phosphatase
MAAGATAMQGLVARAALAGTDLLSRDRREGFGPLVPTRCENGAETFLALPKGFHYTAFGRTGDPLGNGALTPGMHDGMAAFMVGSELRLVRNHEINNLAGKAGIAFGSRVYDATAGGGTTTLLIDRKSRLPIRSFVSLSGTLQNCAGGRTPWGSWITCEESTLGIEQVEHNGHTYGRFEKAHGYCFEVPAGTDAERDPVPLKAMGRFAHEAVAVDSATGMIYLTEDCNSAGFPNSKSSGFYRFTPKTRGRLADGGRLEMLAVKGSPGYQSATGQKVGTPIAATWVTIDDPDPAGAGVDPQIVYKEGIAKGGATFARLEGCTYANGRIYFTATTGGDAGHGQVWQYRPLSGEGGELVMLFESPGAEVLDLPDNITVSPRGGLVICEDGEGENYLRGLSAKGGLFNLAKNVIPGHENGEFAGATFSPDGSTLFVNIQDPGVTLAIWGPWRKGLV